MHDEAKKTFQCPWMTTYANEMKGKWQDNPCSGQEAGLVSRASNIRTRAALLAKVIMD
jgi:hypothetical protein